MESSRRIRPFATTRFSALRRLSSAAVAAAMPLLCCNFVGAAADTPFQQPEQVHIGLGIRDGEMTVHWSTMQASGQSGHPQYDPGDSFVMFGLTEMMDQVAVGEAFVFQDYGPEKRKLTMHMATMPALQPNTVYHYAVGGNVSGWSVPFRFRSGPGSDTGSIRARLPMTYAVYGDQGDYNGQTLPSLQTAARRAELDMVLHVGDMAYDLDSDNGRNGDAWMRDIEPLAATVPYMVSLGNHEGRDNFNHYTQRFRNMPSNSGTLTYPEFGTVPNNWWYSWDHGLVHFVALSTEVYRYFASLHLTELVARQYDWLEKDLASIDRTRTPWIIAYGHRPLYCSCGGDCDGAAITHRMGFKLLNGSFVYGLEALFYKYGVDLYIAGHEHDYERMFDVAPKFNESVPWLSGKTTRSTVDPPATTYIVTGSAGNVEDHEPFSRPLPRRTAKRLNTYGWSRMTVHNESHILWQQVQTDSGQPKSTWGQVMDEAWIVQNNHGPFASHPRGGAPSVAGTEAGFADNSSVSVDALASAHYLNPYATAGCRHNPGGAPSCEDSTVADHMARLGRWQATRKQLLMSKPSPGDDNAERKVYI